MAVEAWLLPVLVTGTTAVAVVAVCVAVVALRAVRELKTLHSSETRPTEAETSAPVAVTEVEIFVPEVIPAELAPRVVQGRVIVPPTQSQVVRTALGRPGVRLSVFVHGLARALRPENRDRIVALMRREYRHRRRERLRAGRQAVRMAQPTSAPSTNRLHEHLLEPKPLSLTDRMIGS